MATEARISLHVMYSHWPVSKILVFVMSLSVIKKSTLAWKWDLCSVYIRLFDELSHGLFAVWPPPHFILLFYICQFEDIVITVRRALPWPPNKHFYKLANQDTRIWLTVTPPCKVQGKWRNNELLKTCRFVFYEQGGRYLLEDSVALYTSNINVIGLYISTVAKIVMRISCWYQRNTLRYGNFRLFHR